jgi:thiamine biosynthesis lipoprotein
MQQPSTYRFQFAAMASACELVCDGASNLQAQQWFEAVREEVHRIERKYSRYQPQSVVSQINGLAGSRQWYHCDEETCQLLDLAEDAYRQSDGLFDLTAGVLGQIWDFRRAIIPSAQAIADCLGRIGWSKVKRQGAAICLPEAGMALDFGGFGKEYAADQALAKAYALGMRRGYVNLGGDMRFAGPRADGTAWHIGIQHPRQQGALAASIPLRGGAIATSGDYERFFIHDNKRYAHILHPKTGMPVRHWQSVSVVGPSCVRAGMLATRVMLEQAQGLASLLASNLPFFAIDAAGRVQQGLGQGIRASTKGGAQ